ncbi:hypothetical protein F3157_17005 [Virgibacillus dakarensis]|uniref:Uncharacterized protein n=1 Tax=Lentibacillus populi TaxID=1827502 RepID=A0A9W5U248_9BACI|nr:MULTISPECIES: DUF6155 family protein [Bacillaceae]MTW87338.1 hypothetical protein [Virgibacillus dakarensis]GGB61219.1 hypothetical protein GCM10011409_43080 [Lentibacillus populi]
MAKVTKLKIPELKKNLKNYDQKELINVIADLYKLNDDVKDFLSVKFMGEEKIRELFERAKKEIEDEFFPEKGFGKMRLAKAKRAISDFKKLTGDLFRTIDLMLCYVEVGTEFTNTYGDIDEKFYDSMESMFHKVAKACEKDETLFIHFNDRLRAVVADSGGIGWGYHDSLTDIYNSLILVKR